MDGEFRFGGERIFVNFENNYLIPCLREAGVYDSQLKVSDVSIWFHEDFSIKERLGEVDEIQLFNGEKIRGKFIEYSGDHSVKKNHSVISKKTGELNMGVNGRIYLAAE